MTADKKYWFPAKRYGWGWGVPCAWQGWVVMLGYIGLISAGAFLFSPATAMASFVGYVCALTVLLMGICWLKGEPPRWRWGND